MTSERPLARSLEDLRPLQELCRQGRLYEVERWIVEGKPLQLAHAAIHKSARPKTALEIALETGQHSLVSVLLKSGYRLELERYRPPPGETAEKGHYVDYSLVWRFDAHARLRAALSALAERPPD
jgi:hypothetical protein